MPPPPPPSPPVTGPTTPGATLATRGYSGGTFTFTFGSGAPAGETLTLASVAAPTNSCSGGFCSIPIPPTDAVAIIVGPAALPLSAIASIGLSGFPAPYRGNGYSFDIIDQSADEGRTTFNTSASGGAFAEIHAYPNEANPITTLQPGRQYLLSLWPFPSLPKPDGSAFIPTNGSVQGAVPGTSDTVTIFFNGPIPVKQWIMFSPYAVSPFYEPAAAIDAVSIQTGPAQLPVSLITGVVLSPAHPPNTSRLEAGLTIPGSPQLSAVLPFALGPSDPSALPTNLQFTKGPDYGSSLTDLNSGQAVLSVRAY